MLSPDQNLLWCLGLQIVQIQNSTPINARPLSPTPPWLSFNHKTKQFSNPDTTIRLNPGLALPILAVRPILLLTKGTNTSIFKSRWSNGVSDLSPFSTHTIQQAPKCSYAGNSQMHITNKSYLWELHRYSCFMMGWLHNLISEQIFTGFVILSFDRLLWTAAIFT